MSRSRSSKDFAGMGISPVNSVGGGGEILCKTGNEGARERGNEGTREQGNREEKCEGRWAGKGLVMPSLQDGGAIFGDCSPDFIRGYFHSLPPGAGAWAGWGS